MKTKCTLMKSCHFIIVFILLFTGCCKDEIVTSHILKESEKSLIPYKTSQEFYFLDEEGNNFTATSEPQESIVEVRYVHPERCDQEEVETISSALNFESKDFVINIRLEADFTANMTLHRDANRYSPLILNCESSKKITEYFQDIIIDGFEFQNVLVFEHCSKRDQINRIVYSTTNGVEFIEFNDGRWLKLNI